MVIGVPLLMSVGTGYLLGSIPIAWLVTKLVTGNDLRKLGSGNVGVMNTALSVTRWAGLMVFLGEIAKGVLAVFAGRFLGGEDLTVGLTVLAAVVGTRWPVWLRFKGGRGNSSGAARLALVSWPTLLIAAGVWAVIRIVTRTSFWATRITMLLWPLILLYMTQSWQYLGVGAALSAIYLTTQTRGSDDHLIIKEQWPSFWAFLTGPKRR